MNYYRALRGIAPAVMLAPLLLTSPAMADEAGLITKVSRYGAKETIMRFEDAVRSRKWLVFSEIRLGLRLKPEPLSSSSIHASAQHRCNGRRHSRLIIRRRLWFGKTMKGQSGLPTTQLNTSASGSTHGTSCPCRLKLPRTSSSFCRR
jgi:hypothetical protein